MTDASLRSGNGRRGQDLVAGSGRTGEQSSEEERSVGELVSDLTSDVGDLVSSQVRLAVVEVKEEVRQSLRVAEMGGGAAVAGSMALLLLSFAAAWGLSEVVPEGVAFLIVGLVYAVVALILFLVARERARHVQVPPPKTQETLQEDARWLKQMS